MCGIGVLEGDLLESCNAQTLTIQDVFDEAIASNPDVSFANLNSKADTTQMSFYAAVAASFENNPEITPAEYENDVNVIFERYNKNPNYVSYLVTGTEHCYYPFNLMYTADTTGTTGNGKGGQMTLIDWSKGFPTLPGESVATQCDGAELDEADWTGSQYCDAAQQGKVYKRPASN
jgi:hypothetical protein